MVLQKHALFLAGSDMYTTHLYYDTFAKVVGQGSLEHRQIWGREAPSSKFAGQAV